MSPNDSLVAGERFRIASLSGNEYELTFLGAGPPGAGLFLRFASGEIARFEPDLLDWTTREPLLSADSVLRVRDELLVTDDGGVEQRGRVVEATPERIALRTSWGGVVALDARRLEKGSLRLFFAASDWRAGDEFVVRSRSGREYRGAASSVTQERVEARLASRDGVACRCEATLRVEQIDLRSLRVLIPIRIGTLAPA